MRILSPSMLSADFGNLERDTKMIEDSRAEWIHIDVMDGVFVPNISFGFPVLEAIKRYSQRVLDVHLMIANPQDYAERFVKAGADYVTFHIESLSETQSCDSGDIKNIKKEDTYIKAMQIIESVKSLGAKVGVSIKPNTEVAAIESLLPHVDLVLVMSVEPGFGGQKFMPDMLDKCRALRTMIDANGYSTLVEIDGGISAANAREVFDSGVDVVVAGSAIFCAEDPKAEIIKILEA